MKIFLICALCLIALSYGANQAITLISPTSTQDNSNPLHHAISILANVKQQPLDFRLLNTPFSADSVDTQVAGLIQADNNHNLIINSELKDFMDYFLSSVGQVTAEQALQRIRLHFYHQLPKKAADQAMDILNNYLAFKANSIDALAQPINQQQAQFDAQYRFDQLQGALQTLHDLRRIHLGNSVADALFVQDEAYAQYTLSIMELELAQGLSDAQRAQQKALAKANLPADMRAIITEQEAHAQAMKTYTEKLTQNPTLEDMQAFAFDHFDSEQAQIVVEDYQAQLILKQKYESFTQALHDLNLQTLDQITQQRAIRDMASNYFTAEEYSMVQAWQLADQN